MGKRLWKRDERRVGHNKRLNCYPPSLTEKVLSYDNWEKMGKGHTRPFCTICNFLSIYNHFKIKILYFKQKKIILSKFIFMLLII